MNIGKYEFNSAEQFNAKMDALHDIDQEGNEIPKIKFAFVPLGYIVLEKAIYNEQGEEVKEAVYSEGYHVDMAWFLEDTFDEEGNLEKKDHPYGWKSYSVELDNEGIHSFLGASYLTHKF